MSENTPTEREYRKTATIRASQWWQMGDHPAVVLKSAPNRYADEGVPWCPTLEGGHVVTPGDWIATGVHGEHWPIKPDVFAKTYELALPLAHAGREAIVQAMWDQAVDGWSGDASAIDPETAADIAMSFLAQPTSLRSVEEDQKQGLSSAREPSSTPPDSETVGVWRCTRCDRDEIDARANGCKRGPCPMVPR